MRINIRPHADSAAVRMACGHMLLTLGDMDTAVSCVAFLVACYLPLYFNGAPQTGRKCSPSFGSHWVWSFVWRKLIGLPLAESRFRKEDFPDASARFIFGSHPHGVMSLHHIGTMMCPAVCEKGKAFSDLSPIESRRDLAAAVLFRIPILREMVRLTDCNPVCLRLQS
jgi:hypothetical protein